MQNVDIETATLGIFSYITEIHMLVYNINNDFYLFKIEQFNTPTFFF